MSKGDRIRRQRVMYTEEGRPAKLTSSGIVQEVKQKKVKDPGFGKHLWVVVAAWRVNDPEKLKLNNESQIFDLENMLSIDGPGCFKCEKPYESSLLNTFCHGSITDLQ